MTTILGLALCNGVIAVGLYAIVYAVKSRVRNPAVLHILWVLVLLKLLTPPLWSPTLALLPADGRNGDADTTTSKSRAAGLPRSLNERGRAESTAATSGDPGAAFVDRGDPNVEKTPPAELIVANRQPVNRASMDNHSPSIAWIISSPMLLIACIWATGSLVWFTLAGWRIWRLQRSLRFADAAPPTLQNTALGLARELGLRNCPAIRLVPGRVSPMQIPDRRPVARSATFVVVEQMPELRIELTAEELVPIRGRIVDVNGKGVSAASVALLASFMGAKSSFPGD